MSNTGDEEIINLVSSDEEPLTEKNSPIQTYNAPGKGTKFDSPPTDPTHSQVQYFEEKLSHALEQVAHCEQRIEELLNKQKRPRMELSTNQEASADQNKKARKTVLAEASLAEASSSTMAVDNNSPEGQ